MYTETSAREFRAGETLRLRVVAPRDGHIYLIEEQDQALQERNVRAGEAAEFSISGAAGVKRLRIVSSATPLVGLQYRPQAGFSVRVKSEAAPAPVEIELTFR